MASRLGRKKLKETCFDEIQYPGVVPVPVPVHEQPSAVPEDFGTRVKDLSYCVLSKIVLKTETSKFGQEGSSFLDYFIFPDDALQLADVCAERRRGFVVETNAVFRKCLLALRDRSRTEEFISVFVIRDSLMVFQSFQSVSLRIVNPPPSLSRMLESEQLLFTTSMPDNQTIFCKDGTTINSVFDLVHNELCASTSFICKIWCSLPFVNGTMKRPRLKAKSDFIELEGVVFGNLLARVFPENTIVVHHERLV